MATTAKVATNERRRKLAAKYRKVREELRALIKDPNADPAAKAEALRKIQALPRNSSQTRVRNRCVLTGRPRAYYRKFGLSRIMLRELGLRGEIPGLLKSSW